MVPGAVTALRWLARAALIATTLIPFAIGQWALHCGGWLF